MILFVLVIAGVILAGCGLGNRPGSAKPEKESDSSVNGKRQLVLSSERSQVLIYFATPDGINLVPVTLDINPTKEVAKVAVEKLLAGPNNDFLAGPIPEGTKLKDIYFSETDDTVYVDLTQNFLELADEKEARLAIDAMIYTLAELPGVSYIQLYVEGDIIQDFHGLEVDKPLRKEKGVNFVGKKEADQEEITVFFGDENAMFLVPITFGIKENTDFEDRIDQLLKHLVQGPPKDMGLVPTIWEGTKVIDWEWQEDDREIVIDFSQEIVGYGGGSSFERLLTDALIHTLTNLPEIDQIQVLIEGEKWDYLPEGTDIYNPLAPEEKLNYL